MSVRVLCTGQRIWTPIRGPRGVTLYALVVTIHITPVFEFHLLSHLSSGNGLVLSTMTLMLDSFLPLPWELRVLCNDW